VAKPTAFLAMLALLPGWASFADDSSATISVSGVTELPIQHRIQVRYATQNASWWCTRYSWGAGARLPKTRSFEYDPHISEGSYTLDVPLDAIPTDTRCAWQPKGIAICAGSWCAGVASLDERSRLARSSTRELRCRIGERSEQWLCAQADTSTERLGGLSQLQVDLVLKKLAAQQADEPDVE